MQHPDESLRTALSALADGEATARGTAELTAAWSTHAPLRRDWQAWQVIGDTLRSDELAGCGAESRFLSRLRERLADEPVVLAPSPTAVEPAQAPQRPARSRWGGGVAVAAGFVAVAAVLVLLNAPPAGTPGVVSAQGPSLPSGVTPVATTLPSSGDTAAPGNRAALGPMLRDARLDAYLSAHRQVGLNNLMGVAGASAQPVTAERVAR